MHCLTPCARLSVSIMLGVHMLTGFGTTADTTTGGLFIEGGGEAGKIERLPDGNIRLGLITVAPARREISFPATVNQLAGPIEVLIANPHGRVHESLLRSQVRPLHLQTVLYLLKLSNGARAATGGEQQGDLVDIDIEWKPPQGAPRRRPVEDWLHDTRTDSRAKRQGWVFVGSRVRNGLFLAGPAGNLAVTYSVPDTVLDTPDPEGHDDTLFQAVPVEGGPEVDDAVTVSITPREEPS